MASSPAIDIASLPPTTTADTLHEVLKSFQREDGPYIYPFVVSFNNATDQSSWRSSLGRNDFDCRKTISSWLKSGQNQKMCRVALFAHPTESWVGKSTEQWDKDNWHCWVGVVIMGTGSVKKRLMYGTATRRSTSAPGKANGQT